MTTTPQEPAPDGSEAVDPGQTADPTAALEESAGAELGLTEGGSTFEPEEDAGDAGDDAGDGAGG